MYRDIVTAMFRFLCAITLACVLAACPPRRPAAPANLPPPRYLTHVVKYSGETLSIIAGWYTGQAKNWELILKNNPGLHPNKIRIGDEIRIPMSLVVKEAPLPKNFMGGAKVTKQIKEAPPENVDMRQHENAAEDQSGFAPLPEVPSSDAAPSVVDETPQPVLSPEAGSHQEPDIRAESAELGDSSFGAATPLPQQHGVAPAELPTAPPAMGAPPSERTSIPREQIKIKTRDELLKELLEE